MKNLKALCLLAVVVLFGAGFVQGSAAALNGEFSKAKIDKLVSEYFAAETSSAFFQLSSSKVFGHDRRCDDDEGQGQISCTDVACKKLGSYGCDDMSEIERVGNACRGNHGGLCLQSVCSRLGTYGCDDIQEIEKAATVCRGSLSGRCMDLVCKMMGTYGCDDIQEVQRVGDVCRGVKASCIESVCNRLGTYGCDDISEVQRVADSCRGN